MTKRFHLAFCNGEWMVVTSRIDLLMAHSRADNHAEVIIQHGKMFNSGKNYTAFVDMTKVMYLFEV